MTSLHLDVIVAPTDIALGKLLGSLKSTDDVCDQREWVSVFDCELVQLAVVLDEAKFSILLLDKEDRGRQGGFRGTDVSFPQVFCKESV